MGATDDRIEVDDTATIPRAPALLVKRRRAYEDEATTLVWRSVVERSLAVTTPRIRHKGDSGKMLLEMNVFLVPRRESDPPPPWQEWGSAPAASREGPSGGDDADDRETLQDLAAPTAALMNDEATHRTPRSPWAREWGEPEIPDGEAPPTPEVRPRAGRASEEQLDAPARSSSRTWRSRVGLLLLAIGTAVAVDLSIDERARTSFTAAVDSYSQQLLGAIDW